MAVDTAKLQKIAKLNETSDASEGARQINIRMTRQQHEALKATANRNGLTVAGYIKYILAQNGAF